MTGLRSSSVTTGHTKNEFGHRSRRDASCWASYPNTEIFSCTVTQYNVWPPSLKSPARPYFSGFLKFFHIPQHSSGSVFWTYSPWQNAENPVQISSSVRSNHAIPQSKTSRRDASCWASYPNTEIVSCTVTQFNIQPPSWKSPATPYFSGFPPGLEQVSQNSSTFYVTLQTQYSGLTRPDRTLRTLSKYLPQYVQIMLFPAARQMQKAAIRV